MVEKLTSDFLVAAPSFLSGAGRLFDWYGLYDLYNVSRNGREADARAMFADWRMVGQDIEETILEFETNQPVK